MDTQNVCSFCGQPAQSRCRRCSRAYCTEHGGEFCAACAEPVSSLPSHSYFQAVLWGLPVAVILGFWFLLGTPRLPGERAQSSVVAQTTPVRSNPARTAATPPAPAPSAIASA